MTASPETLVKPRPVSTAPRRLQIAITGATGVIGRALTKLLRSGGHRVLRVTRRPVEASDVAWDPGAGSIDGSRLEGVDAVIHLAGASIARRWTQAARREILESRTQGTGLIARTLAGLGDGPRVLLSASAVGIYGDRGSTPLREEDAGPTHSQVGRDQVEPFVVQVAKAWEAATEPANAAGIRVVQLRIGLMLTPAGGALKEMLPAFRLGLGGRLGSGRQYMSWVSIDDVLEIIRFVLDTEALRGAVNATGPTPVTNAEFTDTLGRVLRRPTVIPVPASALRLLFGAMADELLLASARVLPARLLEAGYQFRHPTLEAALRHVLVGG
jgi:hypothetical protein